TGNLPAELTSFVGRRGELAEVKRLLAGSRLVTLTGVGGVGKTRLALRGADVVRRGVRGGGWVGALARLGVERVGGPAGPGGGGAPRPSGGMRRWGPRPSRGGGGGRPGGGTRPPFRCRSFWPGGTCCWCWTIVSTWWTRPPS